MEATEVGSSRLAEGHKLIGIPMHAQTPPDVVGANLSSPDAAAAIASSVCVQCIPFPASLGQTCVPVVGRPN